MIGQSVPTRMGEEFFMNSRSRMLPILAAFLISIFCWFSVATIAAAQDRNDKKLQKAMEEEAQVLVKMVDGVAAGQPASSDIVVSWKEAHFLKAQDGRTYVPFTVSVDPSSSGQKSLAMYLRVVQAGGAAPAEAEDKDKEAARKQAADHAFEHLYFVELNGKEKPEAISRAFSVSGGEYEVFVAVKERGQAAKEPRRVGVVKQPLTVPDFWSGTLQTSSVIVADRVEAAQAVPVDRQMEHPYTLGEMRIVPAADEQFSKSDAINVIFHVYNPALDANQKPDVTLEYNFYQLAPEKKFFNKTEPQVLNASTLPPHFDPAAGHQLPGGMEVPLETFPEGPYLLEIVVTDNITKQALTREVHFTVVGS
jgi:hypothetical protein